MADRAPSGDILGIPYNFERPSLRRMLSAYWQPDEGVLVEKPFGVGYTLNLANWRSWIALAVVGALVWQERKGRDEGAGEADEDAGAMDDEPVEVVVD